VRERYAPLTSIDLDGLIEQAKTQHDALEGERIAAATRALEGESER
jgi:hypothetical protein